MSSTDFAALRARFPLLEERAYFAAQCFGPTPAAMLDDLHEYERTLLLRKRAIPLWNDRMNALYLQIEALLNAPPGSVALCASATAAQAAIAATIEPRPGKARILLSSIDFHSTRYLWTAQARRGFQVEELSPEDGSEIPAERYVAAIDERTAVVEGALVSPRTGALLDVRPVIRAAHDAKALVVVDAYQAVGVVPIDVQALGADVVVGGTHKWLGGGGMGLSFMYVRPSLAASLEPVYPGWIGHASLMSFGDTFVPAAGARRFQQGAPSLEPIYTARAGLDFVLEVGVGPIRARSLELTARLFDRAEARGLRVRTPRRPEARGGMICLDVPNASEVVDALEERGVDVDYRQGAGIRVGPHCCHREEECDRVIDAIADLC